MQKGAELHQMMQQIDMISYMASSLKNVPNCIQKFVHHFLNKINEAQFGGSGNGLYWIWKNDGVKSNCQIIGDVSHGMDMVWGGVSRALKKSDTPAKIRLPESLMRKIRDRYLT